MPNDSLNSLTWKAESLKDLKYCSFWGAIICDLISYAFKKNVEAILCRRAKWVTKWTFTIGGKKFHITIKVVNVIQRNMRWVLTGNVWESHLSSLCSLQPQDLRLDFCCCKWWGSGSFLSMLLSHQQGDKQRRKAQFWFLSWFLFWSVFAAVPVLRAPLSSLNSHQPQQNWSDN